jgi:hypothetical protein
MFPVPCAEPTFGSHVCIDNLDAKLDEIYSIWGYFFHMENTLFHPSLDQLSIRQGMLDLDLIFRKKEFCNKKLKFSSRMLFKLQL